MFMGYKYPSKHFQCFALWLSYINRCKADLGVVRYVLICIRVKLSILQVLLCR